MGDEMREFNYPKTVEIMLQFIRHKVDASGADGVVIGLSGGVDSAVSTSLAAKALGADRVHAYYMPYKTSSELSLIHAQELADSCNIKLEIINITNIVDAIANTMDETFGSTLSTADNASKKLRMGNIAARSRMISLFDRSKVMNALVQGTSNKTEILLGYGTWYGDSASSFNPLGELYKTEVWGVAKALDVPKSIINKPPTADLWEGQTDEGELGMGYLECDKILHAMEELPQNDSARLVQRLVGQGFNQGVVETVVSRVVGNAFKRNLPQSIRPIYRHT